MLPAASFAARGRSDHLGQAAEGVGVILQRGRGRIRAVGQLRYQQVHGLGYARIHPAATAGGVFQTYGHAAGEVEPGNDAEVVMAFRRVGGAEVF